MFPVPGAFEAPRQQSFLHDAVGMLARRPVQHDPADSWVAELETLQLLFLVDHAHGVTRMPLARSKVGQPSLVIAPDAKPYLSFLVVHVEHLLHMN